MLRALHTSFQLKFSAAASSGGIVPDFSHIVRRCVLRSIICRLLGDAVMCRLPSDFIDSFMSFQDAVESATARAAVLPRWFATAFVLSKVEALRSGVSSQLSFIIADAWLGDDGSGCGPWLNAFKTAQNTPRGRRRAFCRAGVCGAQEPRHRRRAGCAVRLAM